MKLSKRLETIAHYVIPGSKAADIGTDHGYIPIYLLEENISPSAVAGDIKEGPLSSARKAITDAGLGDKIDVRLGDGLAVLRPGEVEVIIIAGMGGSTIREILERGQEILGGVRRLILQPMVAAGQLRLWLFEKGWHLVDETLVDEEDRIYEIIVAEPGSEDKEYDPIVMELGPRLLAKGHPLLDTYVAKMLQSEQEVLKGLARSRSEEAREKARTIRQRVEAIKKVMSWQLNAKE